MPARCADTSNSADRGYDRIRIYDSVTGWFTQEDPIGLAGGLNLYGYAGGSPVDFSDPFGLGPIGDRALSPVAETAHQQIRDPEDRRPARQRRAIERFPLQCNYRKDVTPLPV